MLTSLTTRSKARGELLLEEARVQWREHGADEAPIGVAQRAARHDRRAPAHAAYNDLGEQQLGVRVAPVGLEELTVCTVGVRRRRRGRDVALFALRVDDAQRHQLLEVAQHRIEFTVEAFGVLRLRTRVERRRRRQLRKRVPDRVSAPERRVHAHLERA
jgi:hypothetical protein